MKTAFILIPTLEQGGTETQTKILIKYLMKNEFKVFLFLRKIPSDFQLDKHINLIKLKNSRGVSLVTISLIYRYIKLHNPTFVYSFLRQMNVITGLTRNIIKFNWISSERSDPTLENTFYSKFERMLKRKSIIMCNNELSHLFYKKNKFKSYVVQNFLRYECNKPVNYEYRFIILSRLIKSKNVITIIDAWKLANIKSELFIVGDGPELNKLKEYVKIKAISNIKFFGNVINPEKILLRSSFLISASSIEGTPNSALEGLSLNNILILSKIKPHENLNLNSEFYFEIKNSKELSEIIKNCFNYKKEEYLKKLKNQQKILNNYNNDKTISKFLNHIHD